MYVMCSLVPRPSHPSIYLSIAVILQMLLGARSEQIKLLELPALHSYEGSLCQLTGLESCSGHDRFYKLTSSSHQNNTAGLSLYWSYPYPNMSKGYTLSFVAL